MPSDFLYRYPGVRIVSWIPKVSVECDNWMFDGPAPSETMPRSLESNETTGCSKKGGCLMKKCRIYLLAMYFLAMDAVPNAMGCEKMNPAPQRARWSDCSLTIGVTVPNKPDGSTDIASDG